MLFSTAVVGVICDIAAVARFTDGVDAVVAADVVIASVATIVADDDDVTQNSLTRYFLFGASSIIFSC